MWVVAWTVNHGNNDMQDFWLVVGNLQEAKEEYARVSEDARLHCACIAPIHTATEPHWLEAE